MLSFSTSFLHPSTFREEPKIFSLPSAKIYFAVYPVRILPMANKKIAI